MADDEQTRLLAELQAVPRAERMDFLADLPPERRVLFKRILSREDIKKLNDHISRRVRKRNEPSYEKWLEEARAGRASTPDAMVEVLRERSDRLRPQDVQWLDRITTTAAAGSYSKRQEQVIRSIYARYFGSHTGD